MGLINIINTEIELEFAGKKYYLSPLGLREYAKYCIWYKYKEVEELEINKHLFSPSEYEKLKRETIERCSKKGWKYLDKNSGEEKFAEFSFEAPEIKESLDTDWGMERQYLLSIQIKHPEADSRLLSQILPVYKYPSVMVQFLEINGLLVSKEEEDKNEDDDPLQEKSNQ